jgi:ferredoxin-type protein NapH
MKPRRRTAHVLLALGLLLASVGYLAGGRTELAGLMTYGNFDLPPADAQSGIMYLAPGGPDRALDKVYRFGQGIEWHPLVALGILFGLILFWRVFRAPDLRTSRRWLVQWLGFVGTRLGVLLPVPRCALGALPILNCQTCEMANSACPIAAFQAGLRHHDALLLSAGVVVAAGAASGRWVCGWLCPFGLIEELIGRLSLRRVRLPRRLEWGRFLMLGLVLLGPLALSWFGTEGLLPFCASFCVSGKILGLAPYYLTTGSPGLADVLAAPAEHGGRLALFLFHASFLLGYLALVLLVAGRVFCRFLCPLGAALGLFNTIALVGVEGDAATCRACGRCVAACPAGGALQGDDFLARSGCIACGRCVQSCDRGNRRWRFGAPTQPQVRHEAG